MAPGLLSSPVGTGFLFQQFLAKSVISFLGPGPFSRRMEDSDWPDLCHVLTGRARKF